MNNPATSVSITCNEDIKRIPRKEGVYAYYDKKDVCLYVGRATDFRNRFRVHKRLYEIIQEKKKWIYKILDIDLTEYPLTFLDYLHTIVGTIEQNIYIDFVMDSVTRVDLYYVPNSYSEELRYIMSLNPSYNVQTNTKKPELIIKCAEANLKICDLIAPTHLKKMWGEQ